MPLINKLFASVFAIALLSVVIGNVVLYYTLPGMVFFPLKDLEATPKDWEMEYEQVNIKTERGDLLSAWYLPQPQAKKTLLFFHGNGGNISHRGESLYIFNKLKLNTLIIDYPGYGKSEGVANEEGLYLAANAAWQYLVIEKKINEKNIIIFGRSLGGVVAADLASRVNAAGLILESTFSSMDSLVSAYYPFISKFIFLRYAFDTQKKVANVTFPVLVIHSHDDEIIPYEQGEIVFSSIKAEKFFLALEGRHNEGFMQSISIYMRNISKFINELE
jgi:hypothetical protein